MWGLCLNVVPNKTTAHPEKVEDVLKTSHAKLHLWQLCQFLNLVILHLSWVLILDLPIVCVVDNMKSSKHLNTLYRYYFKKNKFCVGYLFFVSDQESIV